MNLVTTYRRIIAALIKKDGGDDHDAITRTIALLKICNEVSPEVDEVISSCIKVGHEYLQQILTLLSDNQRRWHGNKAITHFLKKGWLAGALTTAETIGRKITDEELVVGVAAVIAGETGRENAEDVFRACNLLASPENKSRMFSLAISTFIDKGEHYSVLQFAKLLPIENQDLVAKVLRWLGDERNWFCYPEILTDGLLTEAEVITNWEAMRLDSIKGGFLSRAQEASERLCQPLSRGELEHIRDILWEKNDEFRELLKINELLDQNISPDDRRRFIENLISRNRLHEAARELPKVFPDDKETGTRENYLVAICEKHLENNNSEQTTEVAKGLSPEKRAVCMAGVVDLLIRRLEEGKYVSMSELEEAIKLANGQKAD